MFIKSLNYSLTGSLGSNQVALALPNIWGCILQSTSCFGICWLVQNQRTTTLLARWKSPFMWPSLNKALYCCAGEVALLSKTKWTSQLAISGNVCVYTVAGEGCSHGIIFTTQLISLGSLAEGIIWTLHKTSESQNMFLIGFVESKFTVICMWRLVCRGWAGQLMVIS